MKIYRKPTYADSTGDAIPFFHDGKYHIFSLTPPVGTTVYPDRLRTTWSHACSDNLVDWEELETALYPGEGDEPDASGCWTGAVVYGEGQYHAFYTGYNISAKYQQTICHATSPDGIKWTKDQSNPILVPETSLFESLDWRDPYVFYNEEDAHYWIILSARKNSGPVTRRGCIVLYRSTDLVNWVYYGPIYEPNHTNCPECPEMYKIGDNWYLSYSRFSEFVDTIYRVAKSPYGPWRTPKRDGIGGRRFYAAKSMVNHQGRRFYFAWAHDRANQSDSGEWYWGGTFAIPHEITASDDGEISVKMPEEIIRTFNEEVDWKYQGIQGRNTNYGDKSIVVEGESTFAAGFFDIQGPSFMMSCQIRPIDCRDYFGLVLKSDHDAAKCLVLSFENSFQRVSLLNMPTDVDPFWAASCQSIFKAKNPGPDGPRVAEKPFAFKTDDIIDLKVVIDHDLVEIFIGEQVAFTYRSYEKPDHEIGLIVQDGKVEYYNIHFAR
ncbi:MAG: GH32 C-terminal domain-containing protein [Eubacteriales bacterium]|nr:GH32 C-terminal domain-containing protein [Eubacteriales bacterium]